jgi:hypothetical protein
MTYTKVLAFGIMLALLASGNAYAAPKKGGKGGTREKHISREAVVKGKDASKIDFDSVDIGGQRKTPMGSIVSQSKADKNYDFVKIRLRWHPEMVQSASSLEAGKSN